MLWLLHLIWQYHHVRPSEFLKYPTWDQKFLKASEWVEFEDRTGITVE